MLFENLLAKLVDLAEGSCFELSCPLQPQRKASDTGKEV